jgi:uncharacterized SAM-binding protein YcdF (DUF218 family)
VFKSGTVFSLILISLATVYIGGCRRAGTWLVKEALPAHADAMVLLMGSFPERVLEAVDLYKEGRSGRMILVQEGMGPYYMLESRGADILSTTEQARNSAVSLGIPEDSITVLPGDARSTINEAVIISEYLAGKPGIDTIILVSSPSHMRRASMIFKAALRDAENPVYIGCSPSNYSNFNADRWWRDKEGVQTVLSEFVKIGSFMAFEKKKLK